VYTPEIFAKVVWRDVESSHAEQRILLADDDELISVVGLYPRIASIDGQNVKVTGIGGVMTHPEKRGAGNGSLIMHHAREFMRGQGDIAYAVLFCEPHNVTFYEKLGWSIFPGDVFAEQRGKNNRYDIMHTMMLPLSEEIPNGGTFQTNGLPW